MAKTHRGCGIRHLYVDSKGRTSDGVYNNGRGTCPVCKRTGVKVLYSREIADKTLNTCKRCSAALGHGKLQDLVANL